MIPSAASLFDSPEKWNAYLDLVGQKDALKNYYLQQPAPLLRKYFRDNPVKGWVCGLWGDNKYDMQWYLEDCGPGSLSLIIGWRFEFHLRVIKPDNYDEQKMNQLLREEYLPLIAAMGRVDRSYDRESKAVEWKNYRFGASQDGQFNDDHLAWFAGNRTDEFVQQIIDKVEVYRQNPDLTEMLRQVNRRARKNQTSSVV